MTWPWPAPLRVTLSLSLSLCVCVCYVVTTAQLWFVYDSTAFSTAIKTPFENWCRNEVNVPTFRCRLSDGRIAYVYCCGDVSTRISSSFTDSLQCLRSCAMWVAVGLCRSTFISSQSSRIVSIHRFFGLPRLLIPWTYPFIAIWGNLSLLILTTCPKNFKRHCWLEL